MDLNTLDFKLKPDEDTISYKIRCYNLKEDKKISWRKLAVLMNEQLNICHDESYYRRESKKFRLEGLMIDSSSDDILKDDIADLIEELKKERIKLQDERSQNRAYIRRFAREETLKEIALDCAKEISKHKSNSIDFKGPDFKLPKAKRTGILMISDWHYGMEFENYFNTYSPDICRNRVSELLNQVIEIGLQNSIEELCVFNLSDLIAGRIHKTIRLESREDVISQTIHVSEILSAFLSILSGYFKIRYVDVMDNHSRLEPIKTESLEMESLVRIIPWYLKERLKDKANISIEDNVFADDIATMDIYGFKVAAVHGHKDKPNKVIENMSSMTRRRNDLILTAHLHHMSVDEEHECMRVSNGSLMGTDTYANDLRLTNKPSQTMIIATPENITKCIYKIDLQ